MGQFEVTFSPHYERIEAETRQEAEREASQRYSTALARLKVKPMIHEVLDAPEPQEQEV